jgi:hypothetical protein
MHLKFKHTLFQGVSLHKSLNAPLPDEDNKGKDKEDEEGDKPGPKDFKITKTSSKASSAATAASPPSGRRNLLYVKSYLLSQPYSRP